MLITRTFQPLADTRVVVFPVMASSSDEEFVLLETSMALKLSKRAKRQGVHDIIRERATFGEYHHLFAQLKQDPDRFQAYTLKSMGAFRYILNKVENRLVKNWTNWHQPIFPAERLVVTLRYPYIK
ncbi:hypothetical protein ElyMa_001692500 [Elysia marginata]|uniref:Uncharacterized protein n=1 Tax=Elysia marginata TaxID=1093978 RepID=A0AAV4JWB4_9GAST|nr:hypothetical protein ElyMa_001692500 [Elysia marginata]